MLIWRLLLGSLLIAVLAGLAWLDFRSETSLGVPWPGLVMAPLAILGAALGAAELVRLFEQGPHTPAPSRYVVVTGALVTVAFSCVPMTEVAKEFTNAVGGVGWVAVGLAAACSVSFSAEMLRYREPGSATVRLALAVLGVAYAGGLMGFVVQLRLLSGGPWGDDARWGMIALLSLIVAVKTNDTGAYFVGRFAGRTQMTPVLSPKKTYEGLVGGFVVSAIATALFLGPVAGAWGLESEYPTTRWAAGCLFYSVVVGAAGVAGDLAVSLLKRDAGLKNSSTWMPGFGGVLDLLDSILFAAPAAYLLWISRCVGP